MGVETKFGGMEKSVLVVRTEKEDISFIQASYFKKKKKGNTVMFVCFFSFSSPTNTVSVSRNC